ncbi:hypothetical protein C8R46DRAFT_361712 [Mycena filopes]|nr:hypothetical protein C8R46DRAFT_361712 [Mycena filopes]
MSVQQLTSFSLLSYFPEHDPCFGDPSNSSSVCRVPTPTMLNFLNITSPEAYVDAYCLNPPMDSCAFGYCSNPDVASPAVRVSTYLTTIISAVLVLYSPENVTATFVSQLFNVYSLIIAAVISIGQRSLTKPHTVVALSLAGSPFSIYLIIYVIRSLIGNQNRLSAVFGKGQWLNRLAVLTLLPIWVAVLVFSALPQGTWHFQQTACDEVVANGNVIRVFFLTIIALFIGDLSLVLFVLGLLAISWGTAIFLQRREIWKKKNKWFPWRRIWRKVVDAYPFIQFWTVIGLPHCVWILNLEEGIMYTLHREAFTVTYGQILALLVTIPPLLQLFSLSPRLLRWFIDLTWVRLISCRRNKPYLARRQQSTASEITLPLVRPSRKASYDSLEKEESVKLQRIPSSGSG